MSKLPPICVAIMSGDAEAVRQCFQDGNIMVDSVWYGKTLLLHACSCNKDDVALELLKHGADVSIQDMHGRSPLHWAATYGNQKMVQALLEQGADVNARDKDSQTPLHVACRYTSFDVISLLIDAGANVNAVDWRARTPLHWAATTQFMEMVDCLSKNGARSEMKDVSGNMALDYARASHNPHQGIIQTLTSNAIVHSVISMAENNQATIDAPKEDCHLLGTQSRDPSIKSSKLVSDLVRDIIEDLKRPRRCSSRSVSRFSQLSMTGERFSLSHECNDATGQQMNYQPSLPEVARSETVSSSSNGSLAVQLSDQNASNQ